MEVISIMKNGLVFQRLGQRLGASKVCGESINTVARSGFFVEKFKSPYLT